MHVDTDWLDRNFVSGTDGYVSAKALTPELIEAPTERSKSSLRA